MGGVWGVGCGVWGVGCGLWVTVVCGGWLGREAVCVCVWGGSPCIEHNIGLQIPISIH